MFYKLKIILMFLMRTIKFVICFFFVLVDKYLIDKSYEVLCLFLFRIVDLDFDKLVL